MPSKRLVEAGWASYAVNVLPLDAPRIQIQECRRAFYAGAAHMLSAMANLGGDEVSEDQGVEALEAAAAEIEQHVRDVEIGRA